MPNNESRYRGVPVLLQVVAVIALAGFSFHFGMRAGLERPRKMSSAQTEQMTPPAPSAYIDLGSGIYEFRSVNEQFTQAVIAFLNEEKNAGLHCHLLADTYGLDSRWAQMVTGHLLQCHDASVYAQAETCP